MKKAVRIFAVILFIFLAFALVSCSDEPKSESSLVLDRSSIKLSVGDIYVIGARLIPMPKDNVMPEIVWKSSNESVVSCEGGKITALAEGKVNITAKIENGPYAVCNVEVTKKAESLYVLEGESITLDTVTTDSHFDSLQYVSSNPEIATVEHSDGAVRVNAIAPGKCAVRLSSGENSFAYRNIIVLSMDNLGVNIEHGEFPVRVKYDSGAYTAEAEIFDFAVEKDASREFLDLGKVRLTVSFKYKKVADSEGADSTNRTEFLFAVFCKDLEKNVHEAQIVTEYVKIDAKTQEYVCILDALLDTGDGQRSFEFLFIEITEGGSL